MRPRDAGRVTVRPLVASSGSHERMRLTLGTTNLRPLFEGRIYSADEVVDDMSDLVAAVESLSSLS